MPLRASRRLLLGLCIAAELAFPAMAQQKPPPQDPPAGPPCEAFARDSEGDWVAKRDVMVPGPGGMVLIKAGQQVDEELQQQLDDRCELRPKPSADRQEKAERLQAIRQKMRLTPRTCG
jgi:hypothetical protein